VRLIDLVFRPIRTSREMVRIMKQCEIKIEFKPAAPIQKHEKMSEFVVVAHDLMMPASTYHLIKDTLVKVSGSGYGDNRIWARAKSQEISVEKVSFAQAVAMCVNEKLEAANGN
jgi:hypothetical protein